MQARALELKAQGRSADETATTVQKELQAPAPGVAARQRPGGRGPRRVRGSAVGRWYVAFQLQGRGLMSHRTRAAIQAGTVVLALAGSLLAQQAPVGYDDTPMQPNGKWRVHDGKRPQPRMVTPGPARMTPAPAPQDATVLIWRERATSARGR